MSLPQLAHTPAAHDEQDRLERAASVAVESAHALGSDLDAAMGARRAFESIAFAVAELPLPGGGQSQERLAGLAAVASVDVTLARLVEAHTDALAILAELGEPTPPAGQLWGVWAAEGPESTLTATQAGFGVILDGQKPWCSGAAFCTHALVTAKTGNGRGLYSLALETAAATAQSGAWKAVGLTGSSTERVRFTEAPGRQVGAPGEYLTRSGFWHGAIGVAAVWWGAAAGIAAPLYVAGQRGSLDAHGIAHLGAVEVSLSGSAALLREAAATMDARPSAAGQRVALGVRAAVEAAATDVINRVGRALGPAPLCRDRDHARRVADLEIYVRQSHAERDLATLGELSSRA
jgi:alkylation response protein AidB-like acyl-CoA dehydrogenase